MKKTILFLILLIISTNLSAQSNLRFNFGSGYVFSGLDNTNLKHWKDGHLFQLSSDYKLSDNIALSASLSYQEMYFTQENLELVHLHSFWFKYSIYGENSSMYGLSLGGKFFAGYSIINPYLGIGAGWLYMKRGLVEVKSRHIEMAIEFSEKYIEEDYFHFAQVNFSIGAEIILKNDLKLILDGKFLKSINGPDTFPITASLNFGI